MVEQAAIGLALAFCPEQAWEPLSPGGKLNVAGWLSGILEHEPPPNNWQLFRVLVALGLERVGVDVDATAVERSLDRIERCRCGDSWYVDGKHGHVDSYVAFVFHTYGLYYAAANRLGLGDNNRAERFRERAARFASDFEHWFAPDGAAIPFGRSLTYRFAVASFWGALAWADVECELTWGQVRGLWSRHLRWWADKPISDRDGVVSLGYAYDNRQLTESYSSPGSPYWCLKAFAALGAPADHPFWAAAEEPLPPLARPVTLPDPGWVVARDREQAIALVAQAAPDLELPEQAAAKYRKLAYSSVFGFSLDLPDGVGLVHTDSTLALVDAAGPLRTGGVRELSDGLAAQLAATGAGGQRRVRLGSDRAGVEDGLAWSTWRPWPDVRVDTVCIAIDGSWHARLHRIRTERPLSAIESGFAVGYTPVRARLDHAAADVRPGVAAVRTEHGCSAIFGLGGGRTGAVRALPPNANVMQPNAAIPVLSSDLAPGEHLLRCAVFASPSADVPKIAVDVPPAALALLERISAVELG